MGGKHNKGCCTSADCLLLEDTFDRADSTDLGPDWEIISGVPEIVSNELEMITGDKVATVIRNPGSRRGNVQIPFRSTTDCVIEVTLNYGDGTNEQVATVSFTGTSATLTVGAQSRTITDTDYGQPDPLIWRRSSDDTYRLEVSMTNYLFWVKFGAGYSTTLDLDNEPMFAVWDHQFGLPTAGGGRMAIKVVSGTIYAAYNTASLESFPIVYQRHKDDRDDCLQVGCLCTPNETVAPSKRWIPWRTRIDFFSDDGDSAGCDVFNGGYLIFENVFDGSEESGGNRWGCHDGLIAGVTYGWGTPREVDFYCDSFPETPLEISFSPYDCAVRDVLHADDYDSCDPFIITYDTISTDDITSPCNPCVGSLGSFYAVMTDAT